MRFAAVNKNHYRIPIIAVSVFLVSTLVFNNLESIAVNPQNLIVLGPDTLYSESTGSFRLFVFNERTGIPVENAVLYLKLVNETGGFSLSTGKTDNSGALAAVIPVGNLSEGKYDLVVEAQSSLGFDIIRSSVEIVKDFRALLTTDKPIYKPGDTIHLRALVLQLPNLRPALTNATFEVEDPKGNKVYKRTFETNSFGVTNTTFQLADEIVQGTYTIRVVVGGQQSERKVEVKQYVLPKFKVDLQTNREFYLPGEQLRGQVKADYFFGKPVTGKVDIRAYTYEIEPRIVADIHGTITQGVFDFELQLPSYFVGLPREQGSGLLFFNITATDSAEHVEKITRTVPVSTDSLIVELIPERSQIKPGLDNTLYVLTHSPDGVPTRATVTLNGKTILTDENGFAQTVLTPEESSQTQFQVSGVDSRGNNAYFTVNLPIEKGYGHIKILTNKTMYKVGDTATLTILYAGNKTTDTVYMDIIRNKQTILTSAVQLTGFSQTVELSITPEMAGLVEIHAYKILPSEDIIRDTHRIFVNIENGLQVDVQSDKETYQPGEMATLNFHVRTLSGQPTLAVIGINIVDESVYALEELQPGFERLYFLLESELLKPRYEIHGYTFPEVYQNVTTEKAQAVGDLLISGAPEFTYDVQEFSHQAKEREVAKVKDAYFSSLSTAGQFLLLPAQMLTYAFTDLNMILVLVMVLPYLLIALGTYYAMRRKGIRGAVTFVLAALLFSGFWTYGSSIMPRRQTDDLVFFGDGLRTGLQQPFPSAAVESNAKGATPPTTLGEPPRLRQFFPETLYSNPVVLTDETGTATITVPIADSITTWRLTALGSSLQGEIGANITGLHVFQDFFIDVDLPVALTQNDQVAIPVAIYNYLNQSQNILLELKPDTWFRNHTEMSKMVGIDANQVAVAYFGLATTAIGLHNLTVYAYGSQMSDAVSRSIEIVPDGEEIRESVSDKLQGSVSRTVSIPMEAVDNASRIFVKIYPGLLSQVVEGLDSMLRMPFGCFEQTSSITYPNVLVLDYLEKTGRITPEIEMQAEAYINVGYQRLVGFEVSGGGFDWFGQPPAKLILTAYGLMEFTDMAKVYYIDPNLTARIQTWILSKQNSDGSFEPEGSLHESYRTENKLVATAYVAWALARAAYQGAALNKALDYIKGNLRLDLVEDSYTLAILANTFVSAGDSRADQVLNELYHRRNETDDEVFWEASQDYGYRTFAGSTGSTKSVETTALAGLAFLGANFHPDTTQKILNFIVHNKDTFGSWGSTQATIYSLKALLLSLEKQATEVDGNVTVEINNQEAARLQIDDTNSDVLQYVDLSTYASEGANNISLTMTGRGNLYYQLVAAYYLPWVFHTQPTTEIISIDVTYNTTVLEVNDIAEVKVKVAYNGEGTADMVMIDLGVPSGFTVIAEDLEKLVGQMFQRVDVRGRQIIIYMDKLSGTLEFTYRLVARFPIRSEAPSSQIYKYYDPDVRTVEPPVKLVVQ